MIKTILLFIIIAVSFVTAEIDISLSLSKEEKQQRLIALCDSLASKKKDPSMLYNAFLYNAEFGGKHVGRRYDLASILMERELNPDPAVTTPLIVATRLEMRELIKKYSSPKTVNQLDIWGASALFYAVQEGDLETVKLLVDNGADPELRAENGMTPIYLSVIPKYFDMKKYEILSANIKKLDRVFYNAATYLHIAAVMNDTTLAKRALKAGVNIDFRNNEGATALIAAASRGNTDMVRLLLKNEADMFVVTNKGKDVLTEAFKSENLDVVELLISEGAVVKDGNRFLYSVLDSVSDSIVLYIIENRERLKLKVQQSEYGGPVSQLIEKERFALLIPFMQAFLEYEIVKYEIEELMNPKWESIILVLDSLGKMPKPVERELSWLNMAAKVGMTRYVKRLIEKGEDPNQIDTVKEFYSKQYLSPLNAAFKNDNFETAIVLLDNGADPSLNLDGDSYLRCAIRRKHIGAVKKLIEKGASLTEYPVSDGWSYSFPYETAIYSRDLDIIKLFDSAIQFKSLPDSAMNDVEEGFCHMVQADSTLKIAEHLLKKGLNIHTPHLGIDTVWQYLSVCGSVEGFKFVEKHGLSLKNYKEYSSLLANVRDRKDPNIAVFTYLLDKNLPLSESDLLELLKESVGHQEVFALLWKRVNQTFLSKKENLHVLFSHAWRFGESVITRKLRGKGAVFTSGMNRDDLRELSSEVVKSKNIDLIKELWEVYKGSEVILEYAAIYGSLELMKWLDENGGDLHIGTYEPFGTSLLMYAAYNHNSEVLTYLLEKDLPVNKTGYKGDTPLYRAMASGNIPAVKILLKAGADTSLVKTYSGYSMAELASRSGNKEMQALFPQKSKTQSYSHSDDSEEVDEKSEKYSDDALLSLYVRDGNYFKVKEMLEAGVSAKGGAEVPHLFQAIDYGLYEIASLLAKHGADLSETFRGKTPITFALEEDRDDIAKLLTAEALKNNPKDSTLLKSILITGISTKDLKMVELALSKGANPNMLLKERYMDDDEAPTLLEKLVISPELVALLLKYKADPNLRTPLHEAALIGEMKSVELLLENGANINQRDNSKKTALFYVNDPEMIRYLVEKGADINALDSSGYTPLMKAAASVYGKKKGVVEEKIKTLLELGADHTIRITEGDDYQNSSCKKGFTALEIACFEGDSGYVAALLNGGATGNASVGEKLLYTHPVSVALKEGNVSVLKLLLEKNIPYPDKKYLYNNLLASACEKGNYEMAKLALENGASPDYVVNSSYRETNLKKAFRNNSLPIIKLLVEHGADLSKTDGGYASSTLLEDVLDKVNYSYRNEGAEESEEICRYLLTQISLDSLNSDEQKGIIKYVVEKNDTTILRELFKAYRGDKYFNDFQEELEDQYSGNITAEILEVLLTENPGNFRRSYPLIYLAVKLGDLKVLKNVLIKKRSSVNDTTKYGKNALWAVNLSKSTSKEIFTILLKYGINKNLQSSDGRTILFNLVYDNKLELIDLFIAYGIDCSIKDNDGRNALHYAVVNADLETIQHLLKTGKFSFDNEFIKIVLMSGRKKAVSWLLTKKEKFPQINTMLMYAFNEAVDDDDLGSVKSFIESGLDPSKADPNGILPIMKAVTSYDGDVEVLRYLVSDGVDINTCDSRGVTPLIAAIMAGHTRKLKYLIAQGADCSLADKQYGVSPLSYAVAKGYDREIIELLLSKNSDIEQNDMQGWSPLFYAILQGNTEAVLALINRKCSVTIKDKYGVTPLQLSLSQGDLLEVEGYVALVKAGADITGCTKNGSLLHHAVRIENVPLVKLLIEKGIDKLLKDDSGKTALDIAQNLGYRSTYKEELVKLLMRTGEK